MGDRLFGFYFITDPELSVHGMLEDVRGALEAGAVLVQYRNKGVGPFPHSPGLAVEMRRLCRESSVPFIVNDDVELARSIGADGAHVGQGDLPASWVRRELGPRAIVGVSVSTVEQVREAEQEGATYVAASPVFATPTKPDAGPPIGIAGVKRLRAATRLPLAAIGGVRDDAIPLLVEAGADLVCAISASLAGGTVEQNVRRLAGLMRRSVRG